MKHIDILSTLQKGFETWSGHLAELAEKSGVSIHTVYKLASGYHLNPTVETAQKLINVFVYEKIDGKR